MQHGCHECNMDVIGALWGSLVKHACHECDMDVIDGTSHGGHW